MAETLGKKAAKKASGKKRGRPRKETVQAKRGPGRPRKDAGERMNVIDAQDALDTIETSPSASRMLTKREKNASSVTSRRYSLRPRLRQAADYRSLHLHRNSSQLISTGVTITVTTW